MKKIIVGMLISLMVLSSVVMATNWLQETKTWQENGGGMITGNAFFNVFRRSQPVEKQDVRVVTPITQTQGVENIQVPITPELEHLSAFNSVLIDISSFSPNVEFPVTMDGIMNNGLTLNDWKGFPGKEEPKDTNGDGRTGAKECCRFAPNGQCCADWKKDNPKKKDKIVDSLSISTDFLNNDNLMLSYLDYLSAGNLDQQDLENNVVVLANLVYAQQQEINVLRGQ